jgi:hypothetical protein
MPLIANPISQPSLDIPPIWIPVIREEGAKLQRSSVWCLSLIWIFLVFDFYSFLLSFHGLWPVFFHGHRYELLLICCNFFGVVFFFISRGCVVPLCLYALTCTTTVVRPSRRGHQPKRSQHLWVQTPRKPSNQNPSHKGYVAWRDNPPPVATTPSLTKSRPSASTNTPLA